MGRRRSLDLMPISRDEYEFGDVDIGLFILQFLREHSDYAFTAEELLKGLVSSARATSLDEVITALEDLVQSNKVESKNIKGVVYYRYCKRPLGFTPR